MVTAAVPKSAFLCSQQMWAAGHGKGHPLKPERLRRTYELLAAYRAFDDPRSLLVEPRPARRDELTVFHTEEYVDAVARLSRGDPGVDPSRYDFGPGDNPVFENMYDTERRKVGSALVGTELLLGGEVHVAFSFSGGFHHARRDRASGFCVFNDAAVAICRFLERGFRVAYVDVDVHHGDGVQEAFYDTDRVLTISLHQGFGSLFPGTGAPGEIGTGKGRGYSLNVPLWPSTGDEVYSWAFRKVVPRVLGRFRPEILVTQLGVDTHYSDPLASLTLTTRGYVAVVEELRDLARKTGGWLALGGGGYSVAVVPRAWTLAYGVMSGQEFPDEFPLAYRDRYGPGCLHDAGGPDLDDEAVEAAWKAARHSVAALEKATQGRWGLAT